jgi:hypothetical protein
MQHAVIVRRKKISRKKLRGWTSRPKFSGHRAIPNLKISEHQAAPGFFPQVCPAWSFLPEISQKR